MTTKGQDATQTQRAVSVERPTTGLSHGRRGASHGRGRCVTRTREVCHTDNSSVKTWGRSSLRLPPPKNRTSPNILGLSCNLAHWKQDVAGILIANLDLYYAQIEDRGASGSDARGDAPADAGVDAGSVGVAVRLIVRTSTADAALDHCKVS